MSDNFDTTNENMDIVGIINWADGKGITIYGAKHNTDGKWYATLGLYSSSESDSLIGAVKDLKSKIDEDNKMWRQK